MTTSNINYNAVLADLEARKAELESAIAAITSIVAAGGGGVGGGSEGVISPENIPVGAFLRLSIADATKKFLDMVKTKQSVSAIIKALEKGGLPPAKYQTIYAVLRRRESQFGDIIRIGEEWALSDWYPNNPNLRKRTPAAQAAGKGQVRKKPAAKKSGTHKAKPALKNAAKTLEREPTAPASVPLSDLKTPDAAERILTQVGRPLQTKDIAAWLNTEYKKKVNGGLVKRLLANDAKKRFKDAGNDTWDLVNRAEK